MPLRKGFRVNRSRLSRLCAVLLAVLFLAAPALAAERPPSRFEAPGLFSAFWNLLTSIAESLGSGMDPDGLPGDPGDSGSGMDPDGLTAGACQGESGSIMDPERLPPLRARLRHGPERQGLVLRPLNSFRIPGIYDRAPARA